MHHIIPNSGNHGIDHPNSGNHGIDHVVVVSTTTYTILSPLML
jgi:hypothetical protein